MPSCALHAHSRLLSSSGLLDATHIRFEPASFTHTLGENLLVVRRRCCWQAAAIAPLSQPLSAKAKAQATVAMETLREKLQQRYANPRAAFRQLDVDGDASLSYAEFEDQLKKWMPQLPASRANDVCRLLDANGDGMIDFDEFSKVRSPQPWPLSCPLSCPAHRCSSTAPPQHHGRHDAPSASLPSPTPHTRCCPLTMTTPRRRARESPKIVTRAWSEK